MKKEELLNKLRRNVVRQFDMPSKPVDGIVYSDVTNQFVEMSKTVGAKVLEVKSNDDLNSVIRKAYPNAKIFASSINGIEADLNPDTIASAADLNGTDVGIIQGELGVAENGCVWIPQTLIKTILLAICTKPISAYKCHTTAMVSLFLDRARQPT